MQAVKTRRSIRDYEDKSVPEDKLHKLLEAARLSPSARNSQDRKFIVVRDKEQRLELARAARGQRHVATAPVVIVAVGTKPEYHMPNDVPAYAVDLAIALDHMTLVAVEEGLGTCWIGGFMQASARDVLNIPDKYMITAMLTVGIPRAMPDEKPRKSLQEIICHETFSLNSS
jgi:nitroreductase